MPNWCRSEVEMPKGSLQKLKYDPEKNTIDVESVFKNEYPLTLNIICTSSLDGERKIFQANSDDYKSAVTSLDTPEMRKALLEACPSIDFERGIINDSQFAEIQDYNKKNYGSSDWYDYNIGRYGCKWAPKVEYIYEESDQDVLIIETPWSISDKWYEALALHIQAPIKVISEIELTDGKFIDTYTPDMEKGTVKISKRTEIDELSQDDDENDEESFNEN